jgi:mono/diheme cytochrome c family protein
MRQVHHTPIPAEYAGLKNPVQADGPSLAHGARIYAAQCVACHGETGWGDGPAAAALAPPPAPLARTTRMMGDAYLFWRISEGGAAFGTAMPGWKDALVKEERWDLVNYLHSLSGDQPRHGMGHGMGHGRAR